MSSFRRRRASRGDDHADRHRRGGAIGLSRPSQDRLDRLGSWFDAQYPGLLRFAYFVCGDQATAEDLVQDAFIKIYRAGARVDDASMPAYARRTVLNAHRSAFRGARRERTALARVHLPAAIEPPDPGDADEVWNAVKALSPRQRAIVALRFYEDRSQAEIAQILGMSVGAVKKHTGRAMDRLRDRLGERA